MTHAIGPVDFDNLKTMTYYEVTDRVARITFNRPEKGNAIVADTPLELSALVERADLDPSVHVILVSGRGEGFCAGFDLSAYADRTGSAGGTGAYNGHRAGRQDAGRQPLTGSAVGPDDRLPDDESLRARLFQPAARGQADGRQDSRLLRCRRHRHRAARRPGDRRIRRQDRLPANSGWGVPSAGMRANRLGDRFDKRLLQTRGIASPEHKPPSGAWRSRPRSRKISMSGPNVWWNGSLRYRSTS